MTDNNKKDEIEELEQEMEDMSLEETLSGELKKENQKLVNELEKYKQIAANSQSQYVSLKYDFDIYTNRIEKERITLKRDALIKSVKNIIPFLEELRKVLENLDKENPATKGIEIVYNNMLNKLKEMGFEMKECVGQEPNHDYHEPIGFQPTEKDELKGKIVCEFEKCFVYKDGNEEVIIRPAKVLIGN